MSELHDVGVIQQCGRLDGYTMCLYLIQSTLTGCSRREFAEALLNHMISIGATTDILSLAYGTEEPGRLFDIMIVVHPSCSISKEQVESRFAEFLRSDMELTLLHNVKYTTREEHVTIVSTYSVENTE